MKSRINEWNTGDGLILIQGWARDGLTNEQIAHNIGISRETLNQWKNKDTDIADSLKKGKEVCDYEVENALYKAAMEGNTTAQIFWLKNRKSKQWRDKVETEQDIKQEVKLTMGDGLEEYAD